MLDSEKKKMDLKVWSIVKFSQLNSIQVIYIDLYYFCNGWIIGSWITFQGVIEDLDVSGLLVCDARN